MANPNIVNVTTITGKTVGAAVTTSAAALVSNASSSGKILKINSLIVANVTTTPTTPTTITVDVYKNQTTAYRLAYTISVPTNSTLIVVSKDTAIYLEENDSLRVLASAGTSLEAVCSYEEIS